MEDTNDIVDVMTDITKRMTEILKYINAMENPEKKFLASMTFKTLCKKMVKDVK